MGKHRSSASRVFNLLYYCLETENTLREGKYMNEECIGYHLVFLTKLKLLINRGNYIFFVTNGLAFQSFMCVRQLMAK